MTDREIIREMLARAGLPFTENTCGPSHYRSVLGTFDTIEVEDQGYYGFASEFWFDQSTGALKHMAAWE